MLPPESPPVVPVRLQMQLNLSLILSLPVSSHLVAYLLAETVKAKKFLSAVADYRGACSSLTREGPSRAPLRTRCCYSLINSYFRFEAAHLVVTMALRIITRNLRSKLTPNFYSASLLHSHATSFGMSLLFVCVFFLLVWVFPSLSHTEHHKPQPPSPREQTHTHEHILCACGFLSFLSSKRKIYALENLKGKIRLF